MGFLGFNGYISFKLDSVLFTYSYQTEFNKRRKDIRMQVNGKINFLSLIQFYIIEFKHNKQNLIINRC